MKEIVLCKRVTVRVKVRATQKERDRESESNGENVKMVTEARSNFLFKYPIDILCLGNDVNDDDVDHDRGARISAI